MLHWLRRNRELKRTASELYERIVAQARSETFYRSLGVADTMEGRFEMIALHLVLVRERLKRDGAAGQRLGQILLERLIADMDDALRQIGIGDMGVPRRVKRAAAAFGERARDYGPALAAPAAGAPRDRLETALLKHVYQCQDGVAIAARVGEVDKLAGYVRACATELDGLASGALLAAALSFPAPPASPASGERT